MFKNIAYFIIIMSIYEPIVKVRLKDGYTDIQQRDMLWTLQNDVPTDSKVNSTSLVIHLKTIQTRLKFQATQLKKELHVKERVFFFFNSIDGDLYFPTL